MRSILVAGALTIAMGLPAFAADMPGAVPQEPIASAPAYGQAYDWSGFYAGLHVGYGWGDVDVTGVTTIDVDGFLGGAQAGFNWQTGQWVWGLEADISLADIDGTNAGVLAEEKWLSTVRGRLGYAMGSWMVYGTAGVAFTGVEATVGAASDDNTHVGWAIGAGAETALTDNVTLRGEYLYVDFSDEAYGVAGGVNAEKDEHIIRAAVNWKFNWGY